MQLLLDCGVEEVVIAFDKQYQELNTKESKQWSTKLTKLHNKYKNDVKISFIFDKRMITNYKDAPIDQGPEIFLQLFLKLYTFSTHLDIF